MRHQPLRVVLALSLVASIGCTEDREEFTPTDPSLTLRIINPDCAGTNYLPVTEDDDLENPPVTATVTVTGTDPFTPTGSLVSGTTTQLTFVEAGQNFIGSFLSAGYGIEISSPRTFEGRTAREEVYCISNGTVSVKAVVDNYRRGGEGGEFAPFESRSFPVRCLLQEEYERVCENLAREENPDIEAGTDGGADGEAGPPEQAPAYSISFIPPEDPTALEIGIRNTGLGRPDSVVLNFVVRDLNRADSAEGTGLADQEVTFDFVGASPAGTELTPRTARSDAMGVVSVRVLAGGTPGVASVEATTTIEEGDEPLVERSAPVVIRGGVPSARGFSFSCANAVLPAFTNRLLPDLAPDCDPVLSDCDRWFLGSADTNSTECTVRLGDRLGGQVDRNTQVFFLSEAGYVNQVATVDATGQTSIMHTVGPPHPVDVDPADYEILAGYDVSESGNDREYNPRDGLVTLVAVTRGEERFIDVNGNGTYDRNVDVLAPEDDMAEPFVDADDNGDYTNTENLTEVFTDGNGNSRWDPGDGEWSNATNIWTSTTVIWSGDHFWDETLCTCELDLRSGTCALNGEECQALRKEARGDGAGVQGSEVAVGCDAVEGLCVRRAQGSCPEGANFYLEEGGSVGIYVRPTDRNGNCLAANGGGTVSVAVQAPLAVRNGLNSFDLEGHCKQNGVGTQPVAEPFHFVVVDTRPPPVAAQLDENGQPILPPHQLSTIELVVEHNRIDGGTKRSSVFFNTCHYPTQPTP